MLPAFILGAAGASPQQLAESSPLAWPALPWPSLHEPPHPITASPKLPPWPVLWPHAQPFPSPHAQPSLSPPAPLILSLPIPSMPFLPDAYEVPQSNIHDAQAAL